MQGNNQQLAGVARLLLILAVLLLLTAVSAASSGYGAPVVIVAMKSGRATAHHSRIVVDDYAGMTAAAALMGRQRLEDVVAPELNLAAGGLVVGAGLQGGGADYDTLKPDKPVCPSKGGCAGKNPGEPYTRPCTYKNQCERP